jgi:hypothetical protein
MSYLSFKKQVKDEFEEVTANMSTAVTAAFRAGWKEAVSRTPRITGTLQGNWKLTTGRRSSYVPVRRKQPRPKMPAFRFRITKDKKVVLYNNTRYASYVEEGQGPGSRVPRKMLYHAINRIESELRKRI